MGAPEREQTIKIGDVVEGRYRILKMLGAGGMGTVFLAEHTLIKRRVAIKILHAELATDADVIERFMNEARAAGTLGHPNIVESTDMGFTANHVPYIVFEYLEGSLLTDEIYRVRGMPVRRALRVAEQIASALHAAHNAGIVHRDLKTDNVFLTDKDDALDHVKVLDFGISRFMETDDEQTRLGMVMGTPEFMAPEQITTPAQVDRRADIYALGVMLYEMLSARRPFTGDDPRALLDRIVYEAPRPLGVAEVPEALAELIVVHMLAKDPGARPQTMTDVLAALEPFCEPGAQALPRRRTQPVDVLRDSGVIPRATQSNTPWPGLGLAAKQVALPPGSTVTRGKARALYGLAAGGVILGALGLVMGMRGGGEATKPASAPAASAPAVAAATKVTVTFTSDVAGAHVMFRRQSSPAPATLETSPSDIVEMVEVSAPGYQTERYWLTVDRPTHLTAHLVRGDGLAEATEQETLIALGEHTVAPVAAQVAAIDVPAPPVAPAPAPVVEPVATIDPPVRAPEPVHEAAVTVPRKIGRPAADSPPAPAPAEPEPQVAAVEPTPAFAVAAPADPVPAPVAVDPPPASSEPAPAPAVAAPPPAVVAPAVVAIEAPRPAIDKATVSSVIGSHRPEVLKCVAAGKKADHAMKGTITLQLQVDTAGHVRAQVQSTLGSPLVASCVVKAATSWRFPTRAGDDFANISYPFTIN